MMLGWDIPCNLFLHIFHIFQTPHHVLSMNALAQDIFTSHHKFVKIMS
jgi:hypothetical protein